MPAQPKRKTGPRDAERTRRAILDAALVEFSEKGHAAARIDAVAEAAGISKPMIYSYFGDKDALYAAALREAYVQIRAGESELQLGDLEPVEAVRTLVHFTFDHFREKPWFISMLNTENLLGGETVRSIVDVGDIQSTMISELRRVLDHGESEGVFRKGVDPVELYITIASLCYFPISNRHTLRAVFKVPVDDDWVEARKRAVSDMVLADLRPCETREGGDA
ncbi:MAG: TetR family transcriptional regulator [Maritimibacter sp.]|nr:TetR family transcriptional regulator [Maritimibacter sp.]